MRIISILLAMICSSIAQADIIQMDYVNPITNAGFVATGTTLSFTIDTDADTITLAPNWAPFTTIAEQAWTATEPIVMSAVTTTAGSSTTPTPFDITPAMFTDEATFLASGIGTSWAAISATSYSTYDWIEGTNTDTNFGPAIGATNQLFIGQTFGESNAEVWLPRTATLSMDYAPTSIVFTAIPEPGAMKGVWFAVFGLVSWFLCRRVR